MADVALFPKALANKPSSPYSAALAAREKVIPRGKILLAPDAHSFRGRNTERGAVYYETIFIVNPDVSQENTEALTDDLVKRVEKASGRIVKREYWGSRPLSYQIAKRKRGHYTLLVTDGEAAAMQTLEEGLRLEERVLRFLTTRLRELSDEPSPLLRRRIKTEDKPVEDKPVEDKPVEEKAVEEKTESTAAPAPESAEDKPAEQNAVAEAPGDAAA